MINPATHICELEDLDYSRINEGFIVCQECGRTGTLRTYPDYKNGGTKSYWFFDPPKRYFMPGFHGKDYWPVPDEETKARYRREYEEAVSERQLRLDELDKIERERQFNADDAHGGWLRLQSETGGKRWTPTKTSKPKKKAKRSKIRVAITVRKTWQ